MQSGLNMVALFVILRLLVRGESMLSDQAIKLRERYNKLGSVVSFFAYDSDKVSKFKVWGQRKNFDLITAIQPKAKGAQKEEMFLDGVRTWKITTPNSDPNKVILYYHGGAYIVGSPKGYYSLASNLADITGTTVYLPDYRLAPEHYFPAQLEDGVKVYDALISQEGYSADQIALGGDSAGGNLSLVTLLKLKEQGKDLPAAVLCISPWADPPATGDTYTEEMADKDILLGPIMRKNWTKYNHDGFGGYYVKNEDMDPSNPYIAPIHGDYTGCPPVMIQVGSHECLLADSRSVKDALDKAGCVVGYHEWDGMWHVFHMEAKLPETIESFKMFGEFLNEHMKTKSLS